MKLKLLSALALTLPAALMGVPAASAQTIPAASVAASISPASGTDPFYIVDNDGHGYQIAGTGHNEPVLTVPSGNRYTPFDPIAVGGVIWFQLRNGAGNCLDPSTVGAHVIYGESCPAHDEAEQFRFALNSLGIDTLQNRKYGTYLTATGIYNGALVYLAGGAGSAENSWAFPPAS